MSESLLISTLIRKIVVCSRPFSFLPYSVIPNKNNPVTYLFRRSIFGVISSLLKSVFEVFIAYVMFTTLFGVYKQHVAAENLFLVIIYGSGNVLAVIHELHGALNQQQIADIINEIQSIDDKLINLNIIPNNNRVVQIAGGWAIGSGILWIILAATHELIFLDVILLWIGFVLPYLLMYISTFHFAGIVLLISHRFELLNDNFRDISTYVNSLNEFTETLGIAGSDIIWGIIKRTEVKC
ncbi:uncharacterized protein LOC110117119 [Athalia rosae]|uniref:uncharacterized protein LOC110117119 n=1 Tax=Athalia rosae TaxID=37344 RepID=UPI0020342610|nr:uncharacterized protein LOC110117119 [Athalia rosae]